MRSIHSSDMRDRMAIWPCWVICIGFGPYRSRSGSIWFNCKLFEDPASCIRQCRSPGCHSKKTSSLNDDDHIHHYNGELANKANGLRSSIAACNLCTVQPEALRQVVVSYCFQALKLFEGRSRMTSSPCSARSRLWARDRG